MKLLEKTNWLLITIYGNIVLFFAKDRNNNKALVYCNNFGIGNFVQFIPVLIWKSKRMDLYIVTESKEIAQLCRMLIPDAIVSEKALKRDYNFVYCNFLNMTKKNILEIIRLKIPYRHCHIIENYDKWGCLFNLKHFANNNMPELKINGKFDCIAFDIKNEAKKGNYIVIQPNSSNAPERNYPYIKKLIDQLKYNNKIELVGTQKELKNWLPLNECAASFLPTIELIKGAKLYIGNDSGLSHIAWLYKVPSIILWQKTESLDRSRHDEPFIINLYKPHYKTLIKIIENELSN